MNFENPGLNEIKTLLENIQHIAVVGLSPKQNRPSHQVARAMQGFGYHIIPVRPATDEILGEKVYTSLGDIEGPVDLVDVFRAPDKIGPVIDECIQLGIKAVWLQDGVINHAEALRAQEAGISVVMNRCIYRDYLQLNPNTGNF